MREIPGIPLGEPRVHCDSCPQMVTVPVTHLPTKLLRYVVSLYLCVYIPYATHVVEQPSVKVLSTKIEYFCFLAVLKNGSFCTWPYCFVSLPLSLPPSPPLSLFLSLSSTEAASRVEERLLRLQTVLCQHRDRLHYVEFGRGRGIQQWAGKIREGQLAAMWCVYFRTHPNQSCKDRQFVSGSVFYCATHVCLKTSVRQCVCNPRMDENKLRNTSQLGVIS